MQPDITAPGINILAAYTLKTSISGLEGDTQFSEFTLMSGTSMSCPHVSGVAAYVKSFHPDWTPAAIRSAIITTGDKLKLISTYVKFIVCFRSENQTEKLQQFSKTKPKWHKLHWFCGSETENTYRKPNCTFSNQIDLCLYSLYS